MLSVVAMNSLMSNKCSQVFQSEHYFMTVNLPVEIVIKVIVRPVVVGLLRLTGVYMLDPFDLGFLENTFYGLAHHLHGGGRLMLCEHFSSAAQGIWLELMGRWMEVNKRQSRKNT